MKMAQEVQEAIEKMEELKNQQQQRERGDQEDSVQEGVQILTMKEGLGVDEDMFNANYQDKENSPYSSPYSSPSTPSTTQKKKVKLNKRNRQEETP